MCSTHITAILTIFVFMDIAKFWKLFRLQRHDVKWTMGWNCHHLCVMKYMEVQFMGCEIFESFLIGSSKFFEGRYFINPPPRSHIYFMSAPLFQIVGEKVVNNFFWSHEWNHHLSSTVDIVRNLLWRKLSIVLLG